MARITIRPRRRGAAAVEAALVLPLLVLLTVGLIEYGWLFVKVQQVTGAARHGARCAALPDATNATVLASVAGVMSTAGLEGSGYTVTLTPADVSKPLPGETVKIAISVPYGNVGLMNAPILPVPAHVRASAVMAKEGP